MPESAAISRERAVVYSVGALLILLRSAVLVFWPQSQFDADQAITGLMAKHLAELRAFPVFYYGQNYMLAVEAWLAAPFLLVFGVSVTALRLPLLAINVVVGWLLLRTFERETGLRPRVALVPALFFLLAAPGTTVHLLEANGGTIEPFLYVLLIWLTRRRPALCGLIFGVGFLQREFALYGLVALVVIEALEGRLFTRDAIRSKLVLLRTAAEAWLVVQWLKWYSSAAGPGTTMADVYKPKDNVLELANRICWDLATLPRGAWRMLTEHWPVLFGTRVLPMTDFAVDSRVSQGLPGSWIVLAAMALLAVAGIIRGMRAARSWKLADPFSAYLVLVALLSGAGYVLGRCGEVDFVVMRYELLSILGAAGLGAWFLRVEPSLPVRRAWIGLACLTVTVAAIAHGRLLGEYVRHAPEGAKQQIVKHLDARGIRYAYSDYWTAYPLTFLTNERIIVASDDFVRIRAYNRIVDEHKGESVRISRSPCDGGHQLIGGIWLCGGMSGLKP
jgi:hypothetical protein